LKTIEKIRRPAMAGRQASGGLLDVTGAGHFARRGGLSACERIIFFFL